VDPDAVGMVSGVGRVMGVLDGGGDRQRGRGSFGGEIGASHCNQWVLCDAALPKLLWAGIVLFYCSYAIANRCAVPRLNHKPNTMRTVPCNAGVGAAAEVMLSDQ